MSDSQRTVTARSRTAPILLAGLLQIPIHIVHARSSSCPSLSPIEHFFPLPTVSVFSISATSGRNSIRRLGSTSHLVLSVSSLAMLPPSPPKGEWLRLRKKNSRPPHVDNNVFEHRNTRSAHPRPPRCRTNVRARTHADMVCMRTHARSLAHPSPLHARAASHTLDNTRGVAVVHDFPHRIDTT